ncbi:MAG: acyl-CoA dehydrogenase family protein [Myxococcales bacterium]|nr:acyl-CoA dehydrogenase family protein [Myxococcales bacterium]
MGFVLTEEQRLMRDAAAEFARERLLPGAAERDRTRAFPLALVQELGAMGLLGMKISVDDGGAGADNTGYVLAMQAIAQACASVAVILASSNLVACILADHATPVQRERWLAPLARGELGPAGFCLTEPDAGSDASALRTRAEDRGDHFVISGSKQWITSGAHAGIYLVFAKTDPQGGREGISTFVVERGTPGLVVGKDEHKMGLRSSGTVQLHFEDVVVPREQLVGEVGRGYAAALGALGAGRIGIAAQALGIGEAAFGEGLRYAAGRRAFGQRVVDFQASRFALADSRMDLDAAWLLMLRAAALLDRGERAAMETSMAKVAASEACGRVVDRMLQLHGGNGYSEEYLIERLYRDARITRIYEGTNEIQRLIISRELVR